MFQKLILNAIGVVLVSRLSSSAPRLASEQAVDSVARSDVSTKHWFDLDFTWDDFPHSVYPSNKKVAPVPPETYKSPFKFHFSWDDPSDKNHADHDHSLHSVIAPFLPHEASKQDHKGEPDYKPNWYNPARAATNNVGSNNMPRGAVKSGHKHDNLRKSPHHYASKPDFDSAKARMSSYAPQFVPKVDDEFIKSKMPDGPASAELEKPRDFDDPHFLHSVYPPRADYASQPEPKNPSIYFPPRFTSKPLLSVTYPPVYTPRSSNDSAQDTNYYGEWLNKYYNTGH